MLEWLWSSKEEIGQKNLQNHIDRLNAEVKTLSALNNSDTSWVIEAKNNLLSLIESNTKLKASIPKSDVKSDIKHDTTPDNKHDTTPDIKHDTTPNATEIIESSGGTRKKRKNKKHKKKTYRH